MSRPAIFLQRAGAQTPRDRIWMAVRRFGVGAQFSIPEIGLLSGQHNDTVRSYLLALEKANFVRRSGARRPAHKSMLELAWFELVRDRGASTPRLDADGKPVTDGRLLMWNTMRRETGEFNFRDLAFRASIQEHQIAPSEAKNFMHFLAAAGYLRRISPRRACGGARGAEPALFTFVRSRDTGPRPPIVTRQKKVFDGNSGALMFAPSGVTD